VGYSLGITYYFQGLGIIFKVPKPIQIGCLLGFFHRFISFHILSWEKIMVHDKAWILLALIGPYIPYNKGKRGN